MFALDNVYAFYTILLHFLPIFHSHIDLKDVYQMKRGAHDIPSFLAISMNDSWWQLEAQVYYMSYMLHRWESLTKTSPKYIRYFLKKR